MNHIHKLIANADSVVNIRTAPKPVSINITPTSRCNLNCDYCYLKNREKAELPLDVIEKVLDKLPTLKSVEIGMGEPFIYPKINELIELLYDRGLKMGFGSNGESVKKVKIKNLEKIDWIVFGNTNMINRGDFRSFDWIPTKHSFIYVYYDKTPSNYIELINNFLENNKNYDKFEVRLDITHDITLYSKFVKDAVKNYDITHKAADFFGYSGECYYAYLKPLLYADGYFYPCCLGSKDLDVLKEYRMFHWSEAERFYEYEPIIVDCKCSKAEEMTVIENLLRDDNLEFLH